MDFSNCDEINVYLELRALAFVFRSTHSWHDSVGLLRFCFFFTGSAYEGTAVTLSPLPVPSPSSGSDLAPKNGWFTESGEAYRVLAEVGVNIAIGDKVEAVELVVELTEVPERPPLPYDKSVGSWDDDMRVALCLSTVCKPPGRI